MNLGIHTYIQIRCLNNSGNGCVHKARFVGTLTVVFEMRNSRLISLEMDKTIYLLEKNRFHSLAFSIKSITNKVSKSEMDTS